MGNTFSPLRYPGGKTKLFPLISNIIDANEMRGCIYIEPFAGGAGLALKLLLQRQVEKIVINDFDFAIFCIWDAFLNHSEDICDFIENVPLTITEWQKQREIYNNQQCYNNLEIGQAAFYLNRTNVSGVLKGGVIGGISQEGNYKIDARFNKKALISMIQAVTNMREKIDLYNWDAKDFITDILPRYNNCFVYFDPPYVKKGHFLYKNSFDENDHIQLRNAIVTCPEKWIVTYDDCALIRNLYSDYESEELSINYCVGRSKKGDEIIVYGPSVQNPIK